MSGVAYLPVVDVIDRPSIRYVGTGPGTLSAPMKWIPDRVLLGDLRYAGHEVLTWNADCTTTHVDRNGNISPAKDKLEKDGKRIDGISALVTASAQAMIGRLTPLVHHPLLFGFGAWVAACKTTVLVNEPTSGWWTRHGSLFFANSSEPPARG